ncbi:helix-turn-helix domain-containing protein [Streptomyces sp. SID14478]|nr:helix-turn-helix domain-containing protein [Streptomyces sp. SID14478]
MLKDLRTTAGKTLAQAAEELQFAESKMSRIEAVQPGARPSTCACSSTSTTSPAKPCAPACTNSPATDASGGGGHSTRTPSTRCTPTTSPWNGRLRPLRRRYLLVPGLLQTSDYTKAVIRLHNQQRADVFDYVQARSRSAANSDKSSPAAHPCACGRSPRNPPCSTASADTTSSSNSSSTY